MRCDRTLHDSFLRARDGLAGAISATYFDMTGILNMSVTAKYYHQNEPESIMDKIRARISRILSSFALEIGQNCKRVVGLFTSFWILCSYYICTTQCAVQAYLNSLNEYLEFCEADIVYQPTTHFSVFAKSRKRTESTDGDNATRFCICGEEAKANEEENVDNFSAVSYWLNQLKFSASLDDASEWNDGTLMWEILKKTTDRGDWSSHLSKGKKKENWSLIGAQIKRCYPGLVKSEIMLFCLVASREVSLHHVIYILSRVMHQNKRTWKVVMLKQVLWTTDVMGRLLQPRFTVNGPGITHANVNLRNEFIVRTDFPCPSFSVEIQDNNGEIWRETTNNARIIVRHGEEYSGVADIPHSERPIEIVKVSRFRYKVFYIIRTKGDCKITLRPGNGGLVYGSPFTVQADGAALGRQPPKENAMSRKRSSAIRATQISHSQDTPASNGHKMNGALHLARKQAKTTETTTSTGSEDVSEDKPGEKSNNTSYLTYCFRKLVDCVTEALSTSPQGKKKNEKSFSRNNKRPRRTLEVSYSLTGIQSRVSTASRLAMPSSRKLKIRNVTIHRYTNKAMPSIEEYFFGKDFNVDENGSAGMDAEKRQRGIVRLLRHSLPVRRDTLDLESDLHKQHDTSPRSPTKMGAFSRKYGFNRNPRLRREENVYCAPWQRSKRNSDGKYWIAQSYGKDTSSSSDSEVFDEGLREFNKKSQNATKARVERKESLKRTQSEGALVGQPPYNFRNALENKTGGAEILLRGIPPVIEDPENDKAKKKAVVTSRPPLAPNPKVARNRRSGYTIVKQQSSRELTTNAITFKDFVENTVKSIIRSAFEELVTKHAVAPT